MNVLVEFMQEKEKMLEELTGISGYFPDYARRFLEELPEEKIEVIRKKILSSFEHSVISLPDLVSGAICPFCWAVKCVDCPLDNVEFSCIYANIHINLHENSRLLKEEEIERLKRILEKEDMR